MAVIENEYKGCFKEIAFAIMEDSNTGQRHNPEGNFRAFGRVILQKGGEVFNGFGDSVKHF